MNKVWSVLWSIIQSIKQWEQIHVTAWMNLESMFGERSQTQKTTYCHLYQMSTVGKPETERLVAAWGWRQED